MSQVSVKSSLIFFHVLVEPSCKACPHHFVLAHLIMPLNRTDVDLVNAVNGHRLRTGLKTNFVVS